MNEMYDYLQEHNYISKNKNKNPLRQQELSEERAECISNKHDNIVKELKKENQELKKQVEELDKLTDKQAKTCDKALHVSLKQKSTIESYKYKIEDLKIQQTEFIEWLENKIHNCKYGEEKFADGDDLSYHYENELREEILSKYKEIIGGKHE